ncbi:MAG: DinB family protein [Vicinamibacterales bacterium]
MQPRIREVLDYIDTERAALATAVESVPAAARSQPPADGRWSVAEVLEHLALVERSVVRLLRVKIEEARSAGLGPEQSAEPIMPTVPVEAVLDRSRPITAPERARPRDGLDAAAAWDALAASREALTALVEESDGLALAEVVAPHPAVGPLNAYQWIAFVGAHEARHAAQIREVGAARA